MKCVINHLKPDVSQNYPQQPSGGGVPMLVDWLHCDPGMVGIFEKHFCMDRGLLVTKIFSRSGFSSCMSCVMTPSGCISESTDLPASIVGPCWPGKESPLHDQHAVSALPPLRLHIRRSCPKYLQKSAPCLEALHPVPHPWIVFPRTKDIELLTKLYFFLNLLTSWMTYWMIE